MILIILLSMLDSPASGGVVPLDGTFGEHRLAATGAAALAGLWENSEWDALSVAHHETRMTATGHVTHEHARDGSWIGDSCGVMTPYDRYFQRCAPWELTLAGGYYAGALHLRTWLDACRVKMPRASVDQLRICALGGYSGWADDSQTKGYKAWQVFVYRAALMRRMSEKAVHTPSSYSALTTDGQRE